MNEVIECRPSGNDEKQTVGLGPPISHYLHLYGKLLSEAFDGETAYHVGSSLYGRTWRDVDVRIILQDDKYAEMGFGDPENPTANSKWVAYCMAFSELGKRITGLPIDFQVQQATVANRDFDTGPKNERSALHMIDYRRLRDQENMERQYPPPCSDCGEDIYISPSGEKLYLTNPKGKCVGPFCNKCADEVRKKWHP
jgi:hypothetical protein